MTKNLNTFYEKWKRNGILAIGGILIGAGIADCLFAINQMELNQIARGLTIFSAGLTILVVMDNSKTQKETENVQKSTLLQLEKVTSALNELQQSQKINENQVQEIKKLLNKMNA
jgi:hypothetical protein